MNKKFLVLMLVFLLIFVGCKSQEQKSTDATDGKFKEGTYTVTEKGYGGDVTLEFTFTKDAIKEIVVKESNETKDIGGKALETLINKVKETQSAKIDTISGATITSTAFIKLLEKAVTEAGGNIEDLKVDTSVNKEKKELKTDVVVVGGGGAGLASAVSAAENGAKVILIEKAAMLGGNTIRAGGPFNAVDPERQKNLPPSDEASMSKIDKLINAESKSDRHKELQEELAKDLEDYKNGDMQSIFDSRALFKLQTYDGGNYLGDLNFIEKLVDEALDTSEWMAKNGVEWKDNIITVPGGLWPRAHLPKNAAGGDYINSLEKKAKELGVEIYLNAPATELIVKDSKVVGVKGTIDGAPLEIEAKAVVLATGGFASNKEMRKQYNPMLSDNLPSTNAPSVTGDGIVMAEKIGAQTVGMEYIQSLPLGDPENGGLNGWVGGPGIESYYQINKDGKRFMAEDGRRDEMTKALLEQKDSFSYIITSSENEIRTNGKNNWGDDVEELIREGKVIQADTIEELAEKISVDPATLRETHDKFNQYVENKKDEEFGRTLFGKPFLKGPFYASPRVPTVHHTMGGLKITLKCEVLDKNDNVIPGLYAAGEVTGGIHGANRLGGNALVDIHVFGREAGKNASLSIKN